LRTFCGTLGEGGRPRREALERSTTSEAKRPCGACVVEIERWPLAITDGEA
jgi:hypothetical protein